jgi:hypothetical protein
LLLERCAGLAWHRVLVLDRTRGHGRVELRTLKAVSVRHFGFPHAAQVIQVTRKTRDLGGSTRRWRTVVVYAITSLPFGQASPDRLADLIRGHWTIENGLHYPKLAIRRPGRCASLGADETILASISRPAGSRYQLLACLRGPGLAASERQVRQLLAATSVRG